MSWFAGFVASIPNVVWAAIVGACGVIVGAMIAWISVCLQLRHDAREREKEREMSLRQEVYLFAAEQIGKFLEYLSNLYQTSEGTPKEYSSAMERVHIIATDETLKAAADLNDHLVKVLCEVVPARHEIVLLGRQLESLGRAHERRLREVDKTLEQMREYNLQGEVDSQKWAVIQANYDFADKELSQILEQIRESCIKQMKLTNDLAIKCMEGTVEVEELLAAFTVAVRKELNTPLDEAAYKRRLKVSHEKWKEGVAKYIASMRSKYEQVLNVEWSKKPGG
ncbi:MAG TPA: hypothetical protein VMW16_10130 [Sedimentisphaerales bacterium]|nr:hypothetical protein [Sedimentisphaerales bacterium]